MTYGAQRPQVVELPREEPEAPLRLFAEVPGLRVLVLGGDGTVGWILACLDSLAAQFAAEPTPRHWAPPPVSILPLGTGTPPAFCLTLSPVSCLHHSCAPSCIIHVSNKLPLKFSFLPARRSVGTLCSIFYDPMFDGTDTEGRQYTFQQSTKPSMEPLGGSLILRNSSETTTVTPTTIEARMIDNREEG